MSFNIEEIFKRVKIIPVAAFEKADDAVRISEILLENSINILEITLRTDAAFESIERVTGKYPEMITGAGSVLSKESLQKAADKGARFAVAPGLDTDLVDFSNSIKIPFIPGIATPTELNTSLKKSNIIKIFPVTALGGVSYIKSIIAPFRMKKFYLVPTGGVNESNYIEYLDLDIVIACGMSYPVDKNLIIKGDFKMIDNRIKQIISGL